MEIDIFTPGNSNITRLIDAILQIEARPKIVLEDKKTQLDQRKAILSDLDSKLSALNTLAKRLTDPITDYFAAKLASSSDEEFFTASANSSAVVGSHDIFIERLAKSDTRVSKQFTESGSDLRTFFDTNGSQTFQIEVAHPTDSDSSNRVSISVTINPTGTTNDDILDEIAQAVNTAMGNAVTAGTIITDEKVVASVVHEQDGTSRLIFRSAHSGFTYRMDFTDSANSLLSTLEISNNVQTTGTSGGYVTSIGTSATDSLLNAKLQVDGLTFYRDGNTIDDIIDGVTLTLKNITATTETVSVSSDVGAVKQEVEDFLSAYNEVLQFIKAKIAVDPETRVRGPLASDSTYRELLSTLRNIMSEKVSNVVNGNPEYLFEIGITAAVDGTLSITDDEKFENALLSGSNAISDLFNVSDGKATKIKDTLEGYVKVGGIIDDGKTSIDDRIKSIDDRIARLDARLAKREQQLIAQFAKMQEVASLLQRQQFTLQNIFSNL